MKGDKFVDLVALVDRLRDPGGCPWDREQNFDSLKPMLLEECYEVLEALESGNRDEFCAELGDLLFQVLFLSKIAEEEGAFRIDDVIQTIVDKMIRRHPHVFGQMTVSSSAEVLENWESIKEEERSEKQTTRTDQKPRNPSILGNLPAMPALLAAHKLTSKAARVGFDWRDVDEILLKLREEIAELKQALDGKHRGLLHPKVEEEVGDLLFVVANIARFLKVDSETALRKANRKFTRRFYYLQESLRKAGKDPSESNIEEMERLWQEAKESEAY